MTFNVEGQLPQSFYYFIGLHNNKIIIVNGCGLYVHFKLGYTPQCMSCE